MKHYDAIVIGLGAMGSATLYQLSKSSKNILGIDQFNPPHNFGSSSGETRISRLANGEGEIYTQLALRANEIWKDLEQQTDESLLIQNGGIVLATEDIRDNKFHGKPDFLAQTIEIAKKYDIKHEVLSTKEIQHRFPQFNLIGTETAYYEYDAGYLFAESCIKTQLNLAKQQGAAIHTGEKVLEVAPDGAGVRVTTSQATYLADKAVVSPGPWISKLLDQQYTNLFKVYRQVLYWWDTKDILFLPENFPVFVWLFGKHGYYGFPAAHGIDSGIKIGFDYLDTTTDPDKLERKVSAEETETAYRTYVAERLPNLSSKCIKAATCMLTYTPDANFILDTLPEHSQIVIASPCSGGGFKHSAAVGQILAELVTDGQSSLPTQAFSFSRFISKQE